MKLLTVWDRFSGCSWYRSVIPGHAAMLAGHEVRVGNGSADREHIEWCDVMQVQRLWAPEAQEAVRLANQLGKLTVFDVDDDLWCLNPENPAYPFWQEHAADATEVLRLCRVVTTTNEELASTLRRFHSDVRIIPNAIADDWARYEGEHEGLVIGWAGGSAHTEDLRMVEDVLYQVLDKRDVTLSLTGCGEWMEHERIVHNEPVDIDVYHHLLSGFDIGLAPLVDNRFNRAKSDLKPLEYAGAGIPCIASKVGPYRDLTHCYLASNDKDWMKYLLRLIDEESERDRIREDGLKWAATRRIGTVLKQWESVWSSPATTRPTGSTRPSSLH